ncbi:molybdopterin-guanine dinucleotide biosynthesis protein MobA [Salinibacterium xinjiangense]|uniref:Molybdenum cofactor cytidylyltransferase n=1 Tax=Salinibacterium xinjiangense TaxID=386302 RepID=A0A2C8YSC3_9MICO|nr:NTP transferase domain-containing protein [Salinibacterium xinjiangense]GGK99089.1 molybdopterin-guanine dinucleotide biosynthesis protein MobA [Salinibacterium xinjiangense]SOE53492.1 molybdenum cofactor cytidylyltransferase [Salinibacterium xinjiangense]
MATETNSEVTGIVLAAGAGTRAGGPKALRLLASGESWLSVACTALLDGGCSRVVVVLGAQEHMARPLVPEGVEIVVAPNWERGMSESLRVGLAAASGDAALVTLVDLPSLPASVVRRVLKGSGELRQAVFDGTPGHPVYLSAAHWIPAADSLDGDTGARRYLASHGVHDIECGDLWNGADVDGPG